MWRQNTPDVIGIEETNDRFGYALAAGDFDNDGYADLAIGVPYESITIGTTPVNEVGAVNVLYGTASKLAADGNQFWMQNTNGLQGNLEDYDRFGFTLAALPRILRHRIYLPLVLRNS